MIKKKKLSTLTHLNLSDNQAEKGLTKLFTVLESVDLEKLEELDISRNSLGIEGTKSLVKVLKLGKLKNLISLDISSNKIGEEGCKKFS